MPGTKKPNRKKGKARTRPSYEREEWVYGTLTTKDNVLRWSVDPATDSVSFPDAEPGSVYFARHYRGETGKERVRLKIPSNSVSSSFSAGGAVKQYSHIVAIDTTYNAETGVAIVASYNVPRALSTYVNNEIPYVPLAAWLIHDIAPGVNPERIGWHLILSNHIFPSYRKAYGALAIVTDSELGNHPRINSREQGYYEDCKLPDYATLVYASDKDSSSLPGKMLQYCDRMGRQLVENLGDRWRDTSPAVSGDGNYGGATPISFRREPLGGA